MQYMSMTPLYIALRRNNFFEGCVRKLIDRGIALDTADNYNNTPLHIALEEVPCSWWAGGVVWLVGGVGWWGWLVGCVGWLVGWLVGILALLCSWGVHLYSEVL